MSKVAIVTDSTAYIPNELMQTIEYFCCSAYPYLGRRFI